MAKLKKFFKQTSRRWTWVLYRRKNILKKRIDDFLKEDVKFHIGCGDKKLQGYVNIDVVPTEGSDLIMDIPKELYLISSNIASEIRLESVFEHFYRYDQHMILQHFHRILKKEGTLIIKWLPDFDAIIEAYHKKEADIIGKEFDLFNVYRLTHGDPTAKNSPYQLHKDIFTKNSIRYLLEEHKFYVKKLENEAFSGEKLATSINITAIKK
ncbi:hypothetical protein KJA13_04225 [Patescibacteria group bacterium]|nr:hypothetical protein [Patescibacteria group bacterium]